MEYNYHISSISVLFLQKLILDIEAGLRTFDIHSPWPEEFNRQLTQSCKISLLYPTFKTNLIAENIPESTF